MNTVLRSIRFSPEIEVEFPDRVDTSAILDDHEDNCENCSGDHCDTCEEDGSVASKFQFPGWEISSDGSLDNGLEYKPKRDTYLYFNNKSMNSIKNLLKMIKSNGGMIESTCGLHIHVDVANFTNEQIANIIKSFVTNQDKIVRKFKVHHYRLGQYCHKLPDKLRTITASNIKEYRENYRDNFWGESNKKYYALNMSCIQKDCYKTLEFRLFNGTLSYISMKKYIYWVLDFVAKAKDKAYAMFI